MPRTPLAALLSLLLLAPAAGRGSAQTLPATPDRLLERAGFQWSSMETEHLRLHFQEGSPAERQRRGLAREAEAARADVLALLGEEEYPRIDLFYVASRDTMARLVGARPKALAVPEGNYLVLVYNDDVRAYHRHELTHLVSLNRWGPAGPPSSWITEGLAVFAEGVCLDWDTDDVARHLVVGGRGLPPEELMEGFHRQDDLVVYVQAGSLVEHIHARYGLGLLKALWRHGAGRVEDILGTDRAGLFRDWHAGLGRRPAAGPAVDWTALQARGCG